MHFSMPLLPLAPSLSFGAIITIGWVQMFEGQAESSPENTSTSDHNKKKMADRDQLISSWYYEVQLMLL
jgi:hypothetical protein